MPGIHFAQTSCCKPFPKKGPVNRLFFNRSRISDFGSRIRHPVSFLNHHSITPMSLGFNSPFAARIKIVGSQRFCRRGTVPRFASAAHLPPAALQPVTSLSNSNSPSSGHQAAANGHGILFRQPPNPAPGRGIQDIFFTHYMIAKPMFFRNNRNVNRPEEKHVEKRSGIPARLLI
jgi:hypothetical protein